MTLYFPGHDISVFQELRLVLIYDPCWYLNWCLFKFQIWKKQKQNRAKLCHLHLNICVWNLCSKFIWVAQISKTPILEHTNVIPFTHFCGRCLGVSKVGLAIGHTASKPGRIENSGAHLSLLSVGYVSWRTERSLSLLCVGPPARLNAVSSSWAPRDRTPGIV